MLKLNIAAVVCSMLMMSACGDVVIKVQKKPKTVDAAALQNFDQLSLDSKEDFLRHLDGLKGVAVDLLIKELARRDYRSEIRTAIRKYRASVIAKASGPVKIDDSFYFDPTQSCRETGLSFNMDGSNEFLGMILKTAVLAKLSEVNAGKINPGLSKEIQAIGQIIMKELGLVIEGDVDVNKDAGLTTTTGHMTIKLAEIKGEAIDDATKAADASETLSIAFERQLGEQYVGYFNATIGISHLAAGGGEETLEGNMQIKREAVENMFLHTIGFDVGVKGQTPRYSREIMFKQMADNKKHIQVMDTLSPKDPAAKQSFTSLIDLDAGTQCKEDLGGEPWGGIPGGDGSNGGGNTSSSVGTSTSTGGGNGTATSTSGSTSTTTSTGSNGGTSTGGTTATVTSTSTSTSTGSKPGKGDSDDDDTGKGGNPGQTPGQTPTQTPTQSPTQSPVKGK